MQHSPKDLHDFQQCALAL